MLFYTHFVYRLMRTSDARSMTDELVIVFIKYTQVNYLPKINVFEVLMYHLVSRVASSWRYSFVVSAPVQ